MRLLIPAYPARLMAVKIQAELAHSRARHRTPDMV